jgi:hypothetical protein
MVLETTVGNGREFTVCLPPALAIRKVAERGANPTHKAQPVGKGVHLVFRRKGHLAAAAY